MWRWLVVFAGVCIIAALLIVALTDDSSSTGVRYSPPIYAQCAWATPTTPTSAWGHEMKLQPTGRITLGSLAGDGYDLMEVAGRDGWRPISSWGKDGWDLGDWPYVVVYWRTPAPGEYQVATVVEGDVDAHTFATPEERVEHTDGIADFYWRAHASRSPWLTERSKADRSGPYVPGRA